MTTEMDPVQLAAGATTVLGSAAVVYYSGLKAMRFARRLGHLVDDLVGEPPHGTDPGRPGLLTMVRRLDERTEKVEKRLGKLEECVDGLARKRGAP